MVCLSFEEEKAREIIANYGEDFEKALRSAEEIADEIISLSENPNVEFDSWKD